MEIAALVSLLMALTDSAAKIAPLIQQHVSGNPVTPEQVQTAAAETKALLDQAHALLPGSPAAPDTIPGGTA